MTVFESILSAYITALNTGRPASVPAIERDRWIDVEAGPTSTPVIALTGWEDEPHADQEADRPLDMRRARLVFEIYASTTTLVSAVTIVDDALAWIGSKCGPIDSGSIATVGAVRLTFLKRAVVVAKGNSLRCLAEVAIDYRNLVTDLTRVK